MRIGGFYTQLYQQQREAEARRGKLWWNWALASLGMQHEACWTDGHDPGDEDRGER